MATRKNSHLYRRLRAVFKEKCRDLDAECWICQQRNIDYEAEGAEGSFELDHYYPVSEYPELEEDPSNFRASHLSCNRRRGKGAPRPGLGAPSRAWL